ncbi:MAG TPA: molybdopterin converting factor subunit 1 [Bacillota bacterium]|jgi:sulfur carrier protein ThiS|nr:MoaD/ThiS family protein [Bacillota bacterium]HOA36301.1 molybdopterin converting factor subunit 1 [Bacillota bacterium]HOJ83329.1 molybdopterin converting factor subunit 1 [Bacillota bacterium]HOL15314.1 molybdopterin converting factor subunit 1 [Bacillota bacterium]HPZ12374.1 molybdopterin converting factor subunit 1 [Bacillota bacterium]
MTLIDGGAAIINISVELHGLLAGEKDRFRKLSCEEPLPVSELLKIMKIDPEEIGLVVVNRRVRDLTHVLQDGDRVLLAPYLQGG